MKKNPGNNYILKRFVVGPLGVNCYVVADAITREACIIDPGADPEAVRSFIDRNALTAKFIINTHGHGDHIAANAPFNLPIYIHRLDKDFLTDPELNLSCAFCFSVSSPAASRLLEDGDNIILGRLNLGIIHTPGHTPGSVSIKMDGVVFTGDALFKGSIGRTDFSYGDEKALLKAIRRKLLTFSDDTVIYPGHGEPSTIGEEKRTNPFLI